VTPLYPVAGRYIGDLKVLVPLTGMTAVLACFGANALAGGRTLYSVAREGLAPGGLAKTSPRPGHRRLRAVCGVLPEPARQPFTSGGSIAWLSLTWAVLGMIWAAWAWARRPAANRQQTPG